MLGILVAVLVIAAPFAYSFRRQIWSYLTHWKGSPTSTVAYTHYEPAPPLHLAVAGDAGDSGSRLDATAAAIAGIGTHDPYDVLLLLGDNVYPDGNSARIDETVMQPFSATLADAELLAILGNHDRWDDGGDAQLAALGMPGHWWSRTFGDVLIVGLDSNRTSDPDQLAFLDATLADSDAVWKIVAVHHPPYSAGYQGSNKDVRETFGPLFERHGVQLVLSGHDHDYQRSKVIRGVTYVVTGAASGTRRTGDASFTARSFSWHHYLDLAIFPDHIEGRAVNQDERVADTFVVTP